MNFHNLVLLGLNSISIKKEKDIIMFSLFIQQVELSESNILCKQETIDTPSFQIADNTRTQIKIKNYPHFHQ